MTTRIEGPRSQIVRLSTGRSVELRVVPSFRAMQREGLIDRYGQADFIDVLNGMLDDSHLTPDLEDALLRHLVIDPPLPGVELSVLDDSEANEILSFGIRSYLATVQPAEVEEEAEAAEEPLEPLEDLSEELPEDEPAAAAPEPDHEAAERAILANAPTDPSPPPDEDDA